MDYRMFWKTQTKWEAIKPLRRNVVRVSSSDAGADCPLARRISILDDMSMDFLGEVMLIVCVGELGQTGWRQS